MFPVLLATECLPGNSFTTEIVKFPATGLKKELVLADDERGCESTIISDTFVVGEMTDKKLENGD